MFAQLPTVFDRNFAIGYFLPFSIFLAAITIFFESVSLSILPESVFSNDLLAGTTIAGVGAWVGSVFLLLTNQTLIRFLEGYGLLSKLWMPREVQLLKYRRLWRRLCVLEDDWRQRRKNGQEIPTKIQSEREKIMLRLVRCYPDQERYLLPTALGNAIRAFEVYPRVMYGLEGIQGWHRLLAVTPSDYRRTIEEAKVSLDFLVNVFALAGIFIIVFFVTAYMHQKVQPRELLLPLAALVIMAGAYRGAIKAALSWGEVVKAAFDIYHRELAEKLGYELPDNADERRDLWASYSQAVIFRDPNLLPARSAPPPYSRIEKKEGGEA